MKQDQLLNRLVWTRLGAAFLLYLLPVVLFVQLVDQVHRQTILAQENQFLYWLHSFANPVLDKVAVIVTQAGGLVVLSLSVGVGGWWLYRSRYRRAGVLLWLSVGGAALLNAGLKELFVRGRPELWLALAPEATYSFPSGHAVGSSALVFGLAYISWRTRWRWWVVGVGTAYMLVIGLSRLYLGVHYPTGVVAGWLVGFCWVLILRSVLRGSRRWRSRGVAEASATQASEKPTALGA